MSNYLHLNLKKKWYDMIIKGEKKEEYRGKHWFKRFDLGKVKIKGQWIPAENVTIIFSNGYATNRPQFTINCKGLKVSSGKKEWGANEGVDYYVLELGENIKVIN